MTNPKTYLTPEDHSEWDELLCKEIIPSMEKDVPKPYRLTSNGVELVLIDGPRSIGLGLFISHFIKNYENERFVDAADIKGEIKKSIDETKKRRPEYFQEKYQKILLKSSEDLTTAFNA